MITRALIPLSLCVLLPTLALAAPGEFVLSVPAVACPKTQVGDEQLQAKYNAMWQKYEKSIKSEATTVADEIGRLYESAKAKGNLDLVLFWDGVNKSWSDSGRIRWENSTQRKEWSKRFQGVDFPEDFSGVLRKCESSFGEAKTDLEEAYKALITELTKKGRLKEALAIRTELAGVWTREGEAQQKDDSVPKPRAESKPEAKKSPADVVVGKWRRDAFADDYVCHANGSIEAFDKASGRRVNGGRWRVQADGSGEAQWSSGHRWSFRLVGDDWVAIRETLNGELTNDGIVLTRIK